MNLTKVIHNGLVYENYCISKSGVMYKKMYNKDTRQEYFVKRKSYIRCKKKGYMASSVNYQGVQKMVYIHRVVWESFNGFIKNGQNINHKDLDKTNNNLHNLELVSNTENLMHYRQMVGKEIFDIQVFNLQKGTIISLPSIAEVMRYVGIDYDKNHKKDYFEKHFKIKKLIFENKRYKHYSFNKVVLDTYKND